MINEMTLVEMRVDLQKILQVLPPRSSKIIRWRLCDNLSRHEIAQRLNISIAMVRSLEKHAKMKMYHAGARAYENDFKTP
jgi:RNA polymerase sigma factor (sigma-70 family)